MFNLFLLAKRLILLLVLCEICIYLSSTETSYGVNGQDCSSFGFCSKCLDPIHNETCGWCASNNTCVNVTELTNCDIWKIVDCKSNEEICEEQSDCADCVATQGCGWCDNQKCLFGNGTNAYDGNCHEWNFGVGSICSLPKCDDFTDCFSCGQQSECGFCNKTICLEGNKNGTTINGEICKTWDYNVTQDQCDEKVLDCGNHTICTTCNDDPSGRCGWCESNKVCMEYDVSPPANCAVWLEKTCMPSCLDFSDNCSSCQVNDNCGWCNSSVCIEGDMNGPVSTDLYCTTWGKKSCPYDCSEFEVGGCAFCNDREYCSWCDNGNSYGKCMQSTDQLHCDGKWQPDYCDPIEIPCKGYGTCDRCVAQAYCNWCGNEVGCISADLFEIDEDENYSKNGYFGKTNGGTCTNVCSKAPLSSAKKALISVFTTLAVVGGVIAFVSWYKFYWTKRHY